MRFVAVRILICSVAGLILSLGAPAQAQTAVPVPFVGCKSDGQAGPLEAPVGKTRNLPINMHAAQRLAFYKADTGPGVLAPRGWYCLGVYGSGGDAIYVDPRPLEEVGIFSSHGTGSTGPIIRLQRVYGETSGRSEVAQIVARVFPGHKAFVTGVMEMFDQPASEYPSGPYPTDALHYRSKNVVEYHTPAQTEGLGATYPLKKGALPMSGVAILIGKAPDAVLLSVRLPPDLAALAPTIVRQAERDVLSHSPNP